MSSWGILLMAYGSAKKPGDIERYYTHIRHGRPPSPEQLRDLISRYEAIGGSSPLFEITREQGDLLQRELDARHGTDIFRVYLGMKHVSPFIEEAVQEMAHDEVHRALGLVLAPHYSAMSVGSYLSTAASAIEQLDKPFPFSGVKSYATHPGLIRLLVKRIQAIRGKFSEEEQKDLPIIFSAHSLPERIRKTDDPYPDELRKTGDLVAKQLGTTRYTFSWQSAGRTEEPWMGPDILEKLAAMRDDGVTQAIICPCGFVSDHLEVLYDLDIQAQDTAQKLGMHIERTASLNTDPEFIGLLADLVEAQTQ